MEMFIGMSKREVLKAVENKKVKIHYSETKHQIPNFLSLRFEEGQGRYKKKYFFLYFDKHSRRICKEY